MPKPPYSLTDPLDPRRDRDPREPVDAPRRDEPWNEPDESPLHQPPIDDLQNAIDALRDLPHVRHRALGGGAKCREVLTKEISLCE